MIHALLPPGFETLERFAASWVLDTSDQRLKKRLSSSEAERREFYAAVTDLLDDGLAYLDKKPLTDFNEDEKRLMQMLLSFAHIALAVEVQGDDEPMHAQAARHISITRAPSEP